MRKGAKLPGASEPMPSMPAAQAANKYFGSAEEEDEDDENGLSIDSIAMPSVSGYSGCRLSARPQ